MEQDPNDWSRSAGEECWLEAVKYCIFWDKIRFFFFFLLGGDGERLRCLKSG